MNCAGVCWYMSDSWRTYQRPSFVTPPFAGYVSGHSAFSRAAADTIARITGDEFFPGGLGRYVALGGTEAIFNGTAFLAFEEGPRRTVELQWATYGDAADEVSLSRIYGGIHPPADDLPGRRLGRVVASRVWQRVESLVGTPHGARFRVLLSLRSPLASADGPHGNEKAAAAWVRKLALKAQDRAVAGDSGASAADFVHVVARLLPRRAGERSDERSVLLLGAHSDAGAHLRDMLADNVLVARADLFRCDALFCDDAVPPPFWTTTSAALFIVFAFLVAFLCCASHMAIRRVASSTESEQVA